MNKIVKRGLLVGGLLAVAYQGFRVYRMVKPLSRLDKELQAWLEEKYGEKPKLSCFLTANVFINVDITAKFSSEVLAANPDIDSEIRSFIAEHYPELNIPRLKVTVLDASLSKAEIIRQTNPRIYKVLGKLIEKKCGARANSENSKEQAIDMD